MITIVLNSGSIFNYSEYSYYSYDPYYEELFIYMNSMMKCLKYYLGITQEEFLKIIVSGNPIFFEKEWDRDKHFAKEYLKKYVKGGDDKK